MLKEERLESCSVKGLIVLVDSWSNTSKQLPRCLVSGIAQLAGLGKGLSLCIWYL